MVLRAIAALVALLLLVLLGRALAPPSLGAVLYAWGWLELVAVLASLGFDPLIVRVLPVALAAGDWGRLRGLLRVADRVAVSSSLLLAALATLWLYGLGAGGEPGESDKAEMLLCLMLAAWALPFRSVSILRQAALVALERPLQGLMLLPLLQPGLTLLVLASALALGAEPSAASVVVVAGLATALTAAFGARALQLRLAASLTTHSLRGAGAKPEIAERTLPSARAWVFAASPYFLFVVSELANARIDLLVVGGVLGAREAADYGVAARASEVLRFGLLAVSPLVSPAMAREAASGNASALRLVVGRASRVGFLLTLPIAALVIGAAPLLLAVVHPDYAEAANLLRVLACGYLGLALAGPAIRLLLNAGEEQVVAAVFASAALANLLLDLLLVPRWGGIAAAAVTASLTVATALVLGGIAKRRLGVSTWVWSRSRG